MPKWRWMAFTAFLIGFILAAMRQMPLPLVDCDYMDALGSANRLLSAWQEKNGPAGLAHMSPGLRRRFSDAELRQWVLGKEPFVSRSFEIGSGRRLTESQYLFRVRLIERRTGQKWGRPRRAGIILTRNVRGQWMGEALPCGPGEADPGGTLGRGGRFPGDEARK